MLLAALCLCLNVQGAEQITQDEADQDWSSRNASTSQGKILWTDGDDVYFYDGVSVTTIQQRDNGAPSLSGGVDTGTVFTLGTGNAPGGVLAAWRRGDNGDYAWLWSNTPGPGGTSVEVIDPVNPFDENVRHNPEGVDIADGCVFMSLQAFFNANGVKHLFQINAATGEPTNLTGTDPIVGVSRVSSSGCQAAWLLDRDSFADPNDEPPPELWFYDGAAAALIDTGAIGLRPRLSAGVLVYTKTVGGVSQVFLYDTRESIPAPIQITHDTSGGNFFAQTDGWRIAWFHGNADQTDLHIALNGGVQLTDGLNQPADPGNAEVPLQLSDGQLLWKDQSGRLRYETGKNTTYDALASVPVIDTRPAATVEKPWLADGYVAWLGLSEDGGTDKEVFLFTGTPPDEAAGPAPPLLVLAAPGDREVTLAWDLIAGADGYTVYYAAEPGVTKENYASLREGARIADAAPPLTISGLADNRPYYFVVTTRREGAEGPGSRTACATPFAAHFAPVDGLQGIDMRAIAVDPVEPLLAYAAGVTDVYVSTDGGFTFTGPAKSAVSGRSVRALAARGGRVLAATQDGDILRSENAGVDWELTGDGEDLGEINKSLVIDPASPSTVYAGNFRLPSYVSGVDSYVIKSTDGGAMWSHLPETDAPGGEIRAYALAVDSAGAVYAGGTGTPNLAVSASGGGPWVSRAIPGLFAVYALAIDPVSGSILYAAANGLGFPQINTVFKTNDAAMSWDEKGFGLPTEPGFFRTILADPDRPQTIYLGGDDGVYYSPDGGEHWVPRNAGLGAKAVPTVYGLALTRGRLLLAATSNGLFTLDLAEENRAPVVISPGAQTNTEQDVVLLPIEARDPDDDTLMFFAQGLPPGLGIDPDTGEISGAILSSSAGLYAAQVSATDGNLSDTVGFAWTVNMLSVNHAPILTSPGDQSNTEGDAISLQLTATDEDGDTLVWDATGLPPALAINPDTGAISGILPVGSAGVYNVTVTVSDGSLEDSALFEWVVSPLLPEQAANPNPANHAAGVSIGATLSWTPGTGAISHDVYFGSDSPPPFVENQVETVFDPGPLSYGVTYFWRIDERNASGVTPGAIWTFRAIDPPGLEAEPLSLRFGSPGGGAAITVTNPGGAPLEWAGAVAGEAGWLHLTLPKGEGGGVIQVACDRNSEAAAREAVIRIQATNAALDPVDISVTQGRLGDINGDNTVTSVDVQITILGALDIGTAYSTDLDGNGFTNAVDVQLAILAALE